MARPRDQCLFPPPPEAHVALKWSSFSHFAWPASARHQGILACLSWGVSVGCELLRAA